MKTPGQRGSFGSWLQAERTRRYKTQREALDAMRRMAGLRIAESEYAQWESGSRVPREDNPKVARLYEFFGSRPDDGSAEPEPTGSNAELVAVIRQQNDWMRAYVEQTDRRFAMLEAVIATLSGGLSGEDPAVREVALSWGRDALARSRSQAPQRDPLRSTEG